MNWREVWEKKYEERAGASFKGGPRPEFWDKVAEDFSEWNKSNDYECGRKAIEAIREIVNPNFEAVDIGAGPGTLAVPFAKAVRKMTAIESSPVMISHLLKNAEEGRVHNIEVINKSWQEINDADVRKKFDIVACSHLLWQFKDVDSQLKRMEDASRGYCCVLHPAGGREALVRSLWSELIGKEYAGEVDPDLDDLVFAMLRQRGVLVNVKVIDFTGRRSMEQETRYISRLLGKYVEVTPDLREKVEKTVFKKLQDGVYETNNNAVVMWWKAPPL